MVISVESEEGTPCCVIHKIKSQRALTHVQNVSTHAPQSTQLSQIERITVSNAPNLPLIVVSRVVHCNYFVGAPQRAADHNLALGHAASRIIIKHRKKIEARLSSLRFSLDMSQTAECVCIIS